MATNSKDFDKFILWNRKVCLLRTHPQRLDVKGAVFSPKLVVSLVNAFDLRDSH